MKKLHRIGNSHTPQAHQLPKIADNLRYKLSLDYVNLTISNTSYASYKTSTSYKLAFQPGLDNTECSIHSYKSWPKLLLAYHNFMKGSS